MKPKHFVTQLEYLNLLNRIEKLERKENNDYDQGYADGYDAAVRQTELMDESHTEESVRLTEENRIKELHARVKVNKNNQVVLKGNIVNSLAKFIAGDAMLELDEFQYERGFVLERKDGVLQLRFHLHESKRYKQED